MAPAGRDPNRGLICTNIAEHLVDPFRDRGDPANLDGGLVVSEDTDDTAYACERVGDPRPRPGGEVGGQAVRRHEGHLRDLRVGSPHAARSEDALEEQDQIVFERSRIDAHQLAGVHIATRLFRHFPDELFDRRSVLFHAATGERPVVGRIRTTNTEDPAVLIEDGCEDSNRRHGSQG